MKLEDLKPSVRWALIEIAKLIEEGENGEVTVEYSQRGVRELRCGRRRRPPKDDLAVRQARQ